MGNLQNFMFNFATSFYLVNSNLIELRFSFYTSSLGSKQKAAPRLSRIIYILKCILFKKLSGANHLIYMYMFSLTPPHIYVSKCMYIYVHISLSLPECACTTIIDISKRIFSLIYCCVSIIIVICICPPWALIWLINLFLFLFL
jgi:hypothetical protein